tara:strand:+ start:1214 stop:1471 length:258 start_codon:yes stop_codon:yes gene_type:complete
MNDNYWNMDDIMDKLDGLEKKVDELIVIENNKLEGKTPSFQVVATKGSDSRPVADYIFQEMKKAIVFHNEMTEKGYNVELNRVWI